MGDNEAIGLIVEPAHAAQTLAKTVALFGGSAPAWLVGQISGLGPWNATEEWELDRWVAYAEDSVQLVDPASTADLVARTAPTQRLRALRLALDLLESHPVDPGLLENIGDRLVDLGELVDARLAFLRAATECEFEGDFGNAGRLIWQSVDLSREAIYPHGATRFDLIRRAARHSLAAEQPAALDDRLCRALKASEHLSLGEEAVLLALRSSAKTAMGRARDARTLIAEALELVGNQLGEHAGFVHQVAARRATMDNDVEALRRVSGIESIEPGPQISAEDANDVSLTIGQAFALVTDGKHEHAVRVLQAGYVAARHARKSSEAARALYAAGLVESSMNGPSPKCLELLGRAALLADADSEAAFFFRVGELVMSTETADLERAHQLVVSVDPSLHSEGVRLSFHQAQALLSLAQDKVETARHALELADPLALSQDNAQDTGLQLQIWAEYFRRTGSMESAVKAIGQSLQWMQPGANESMRVLTVLEAVRIHRDSGTPIGEHNIPDLIESIHRETALGRAFHATCLAEYQQDAEAMLAAARELEGVHHHTQARFVRDRAQYLMHHAGSLSRRTAIPLTRREIDVLRYLASGQSNKEIAARLTISRRTVDKHVTNIYRKLSIHSRAAATSYWHTRCVGL